MDKRQQLDLMDKVQRELDDLNNSQTSVLKKLSQIAAHNITLGAALLDDKRLFSCQKLFFLHLVY
jgi:hypothetical protein